MHDRFDDFSKVFFALCKSANTPYSLSLWLRWKYKEYVSARPPRAADYEDADSFAVDYLLYSWPSKAKVEVPGIDVEAQALISFIEDESVNAKTNERLSGVLSGEVIPPALISAVLPKIQRKISDVLGTLSYVKVFSEIRIGNGASVSLPRARARFDKKMTTVPLTVSPDALGLARCIIESDPAWASALLRAEVLGPFSLIPEKVFQLTGYNAFDTVPKNMKTNRTIAKEPVCNGFLQQSVHIYLRVRLKRFGIDLRDQTMNQYLASVAHWAGLSTLDLKSASNSVTWSLIQLLFPVDWYVLLDILRSHNTLMPDGEVHPNQMFSSMGNAFTFELETLIFWAISSSIAGETGPVSVYGDDIICPRHCAEDIITVLSFFGFRVNPDKSFISGRFFESCGKHYFDGSDVTPVFQKEAPLTDRLERIRSNNRLIRWALRRGCPEIALLHKLVRSACQVICRDETGRIPSGPVFLHEDDSFAFDPFAPSPRYTASGEGVVWGLREKFKESRTRQGAAYAYALSIAGEGRVRSASQTSIPRRKATALFLRRNVSRYLPEMALMEIEALIRAGESGRLSVSVDPKNVTRVEKVPIGVVRENHAVGASWA